MTIIVPVFLRRALRREIIFWGTQPLDPLDGFDLIIRYPFPRRMCFEQNSCNSIHLQTVLVQFLPKSNTLYA